MKARLHIWGMPVLAFVLLILLSGCFDKNVEKMYQLPQQSEDSIRLQNKINQILNSGAEYSAPKSGVNRQSVQLLDIDGDGSDEAIAFFSVSSEEKPLKIYIFRETDGAYETAAVIESEGTAIDSILYSDLTGDGVMEIIVGWKLDGDIQMATAYSLTDYQVTKLAHSAYTHYITYDLDGGGLEDLIVAEHDSAAQTGTVRIYRWDGEMQMDSVTLSGGMESIYGITGGALLDDVPAVYIEGVYGGPGVITDIITWRDGSPKNIAANGSGFSESTVRSYAVRSADINGDNVPDIPEARPLTVAKKGGANSFYALRWHSFDSSGSKTLVSTTYHNYSDNWYLEIPEHWIENLSLYRTDEVSGERALVFSTADGGSQREFLTIYTLSGANKEERAGLSGRFILRTEGDVIYAAEILGDPDDSALTPENVIERFYVIYSQWHS